MQQRIVLFQWNRNGARSAAPGADRNVQGTCMCGWARAWAGGRTGAGAGPPADVTAVWLRQQKQPGPPGGPEQPLGLQQTGRRRCVMAPASRRLLGRRTSASGERRRPWRRVQPASGLTAPIAPALNPSCAAGRRWGRSREGWAGLHALLQALCHARPACDLAARALAATFPSHSAILPFLCNLSRSYFSHTGALTG